MRKFILPVLFLTAPLSVVTAQSTAVRYIIGETHKVYARPVFDNFCMGAGVDRSFNDRLTIGFDITYDIGHALKTEPEYISLTSDGYEGNYEMKPKLLSLNYHTEYALADNDGTHVYIGTFLGLRHISQQWTLQPSYNNNGNPDNGPYPTLLSVSKWLMPVGLRMGVRGSTDGGFMDFYTAVGYQVGGGDQVAVGAKYEGKGDYLDTSSLAVTIGLAYGFGW